MNKVCLFLCLWLFIGCNNNPVTPVVATTYYNVGLRLGAAIAVDSVQIGVWLSICSDPLTMINAIELKINNQTVDSLYHFPSSGTFYPTYWAWSWQDIRQEQKISIKTFTNEVSGSIYFPDTVSILSPKDRDTIVSSSSFILKWQGNADYYLLHCWTEEHDIIATDTEVTVPPHWVPKISNATVEISVAPINGPLPDTASYGNLSGSGHGFLRALNDPKVIRVYAK